MLRRTDVIGFAGLAMLLTGAVLFLTGSEGELTWVYWMTGTCVWLRASGCCWDGSSGALEPFPSARRPNPREDAKTRRELCTLDNQRK